MAITWRPASSIDIEPCLSIQPKYLGDALIGGKAALEAWKHVVRDRFVATCVMESSSLPRGQRIVGFGASVFVTSAFSGAELANPRPDINSRVMASIHSGQSVLATIDDVARANAGDGVSVLALCGTWRDDIISQPERHDVQTLLATTFVEWHLGYRIRRILNESADDQTEDFVRRSIEFRTITEFREIGRALFVMTRESVHGIPGSIGNVLFSYREPVLRLRDSDQQLLLAALRGATDSELATELGVTFSAVKARWRSAFARIAEVMPDLVTDADDHEGRGTQKRHRVMAYVRSHMEELRPYDWKAKGKVASGGIRVNA